MTGSRMFTIGMLTALAVFGNACVAFAPKAAVAPKAVPAQKAVQVSKAAPAQTSKALWSVTTDRKSSLYKCGENSTFTIGASLDGRPVKKGYCTVQLTLDGGNILQTQVLDFSKANPAKLTATLKTPGFIRCNVSKASKELAVKRYPAIGAGFDPEKIQPVVKAPADFMKFWIDGMAALDKTPLDLKLEKLPKYCNTKCTGYAISVAGSQGTRASGFLSIPNKKGKYPVIITVPGAGPGACSPMMRGDRVALTMNVHRYAAVPGDVKATKELYAQYNKNCGTGTYSRQNARDREKYFFRLSYLGIMRAVKYVLTRPEWDGKNVEVQGSSQGGASTIIIAALEPRVTCAGPNVPALGDHFGHRAGHQDGWPKLVSNTILLAKQEAAEQKLAKIAADKYVATQKAAVEETAPYFDVVNFAAHVKCPIIFGVGLVDPTCPPSGVYAAYNQCKGPKNIIPTPDMGHHQSKEYTAARTAWFQKYLVK